MSFRSGSGDSAVYDHNDNLARDCREFYERRLRLADTASKKWGPAAVKRDNDVEFSRLPAQIAQLRSELLSLAHMDNELFKHLLTLNDKLEEMRHQATSSNNSTASRVKEESVSEEEEEDDAWPHVDPGSQEQQFASLPPSQVLEHAVGEREEKASNSGGMTGGLRFMLRSRSFLLRPPFHRKHVSFPATRQNRRRDPSPRSFDLSQQGPGSSSTSGRSASVDRKNKKLLTAKDIQGPFASLSISQQQQPSSSSSSSSSRGHHMFHLPQTSRSLWQRVFVSNGIGNNGPESLPCSWNVVDGYGDDKSPPPTLKHIKQNSFDSGIHASDSSEYSIKV